MENNKKLHQMLEDGMFHSAVELVLKENKELKEKLEKCKEALEYYAAGDNWASHIMPNYGRILNSINESDITTVKGLGVRGAKWSTGGKRARQVLKELEGE